MIQIGDFVITDTLHDTPSIGGIMAAQPPTNKILIVIPFWNGDKNQAMSLARLLADIQKDHSKEADLLFVSRFDTGHDRETVEYVSRSFNVYTHRSGRREVGWPHGCNGTFFGSMEFLYGNILTGRIPNYKGIFMAESDGAPLYKDWITRLVGEWDRLSTPKKIVIMGDMIPDADAARNNPHINGGACMLSTNESFLKWVVIDVGSVTRGGGWDWVMTKSFAKMGWAGTPMVRSQWNRKTDFTLLDWQQNLRDGVVWFHGQKEYSLHKLARELLV